MKYLNITNFRIKYHWMKIKAFLLINLKYNINQYIKMLQIIKRFFNLK